MISLALAMTVSFAQQPDLDALATRVARATVSEFAGRGLNADELSITVGVIDRAQNRVQFGSYRGDVPTYPASVVKAFWLVYLADQLQKGERQLDPETERAARDMIVVSSNDATGHIVDVTTGTTSGPLLEGADLQAWIQKRNAANRWFANRGYVKINVNQKTWGDGPYGRERAFYGATFENRNSLTTEACVRLFGEIALDASLDRITGVSAGARNWSQWVKDTLARKNPADHADADGQAAQYIGKSLPKGAKLWSKAGWTTTVRHDAAYVVMPDGRELLLAIFTSTRENAVNRDIIPFAAKGLLDAR